MSLLDPHASALLVVDIQERFRTAQPGFPLMLENACRLARAFRILGLPILVTEQYPKGLGSTVPEMKEALGSGEGAPPPVGEKTSFSSHGCAGIAARLVEARARCVLVCGIETHVCVNQSVHDLLAAGYRVHVAADAVQSRRAQDHEVALRRMERSGAVLTTAEMAVFELLRDSRHPRFREAQALFK